MPAATVGAWRFRNPLDQAQAGSTLSIAAQPDVDRNGAIGARYT